MPKSGQKEVNMFDPTTRILVVDDMGTMRKLVMRVCKEVGFTDLIEAADGVLAWNQLITSNPPVGLVISDWNMPNCTGLELLKKLRGDPKYKQIPFMLVTAEAEQHQIIQALTAGVNGYIVKPFTAATLKEKLESVHQKVSGVLKAG
jgi:two-component system chemotaxis response regulator CheY